MRAVQVMQLQGDDLHYIVNQGWEPVLAFRHDDGNSQLFQVGETTCSLINDAGDRLTMQQAARICDPAGTEDVDDENQQYTIRVSDGQVVRVSHEVEKILLSQDGQSIAWLGEDGCSDPSYFSIHSARGQELYHELNN